MESTCDALIEHKYRLIRLLGEGGMGAVYEADNLADGSRVAVKMLSSRLEDPSAVARFELEARALAAVRHPNLVRLMDYSSNRLQPYLVMELAPGKSLADIVMAEGTLSAGRVARIAVQLLGALGAAHSRWIIHRDVKPQNVQIDAMPEGDAVKLLDFGLAKNTAGSKKHALTQDGMVVGTLHYMAPEQARCIELDARADIYGVGACMYYALTGRRLFEGISGVALYRAVVASNPPEARKIRSALPEAICAIVHRALAKDPQDRFSSAREMAGALVAFLREEAFAQMSPSPLAYTTSQNARTFSASPIPTTYGACPSRYLSFTPPSHRPSSKPPASPAPDRRNPTTQPPPSWTPPSSRPAPPAMYPIDPPPTKRSGRAIAWATCVTLVVLAASASLFVVRFDGATRARVAFDRGAALASR